LFLLLFHAPSSTSSSVLPLCNPHDNSNLLHFKNSFAIDTSLYREDGSWCSSYSNKIASWKNGTDCCHWDGVTCHTSSGHVIGLDLSCAMLVGQFDPNSTLFHLTQLTYLDLSWNRLRGEIPSLLSNLKHLTYLDLSSNRFISGHIPDVFDNFTKLDTLDLSFNSLGARLQNLASLDLSNNKIHGKIPNWFNDNLLHTWNSSLYFIDLSFNKLQGDLPIPPHEIGILSVPNNNFTGNKSSTFCNATLLEALILSHNHLSGMIPQCLGASPYLSILDLQVNNLHGSMPTKFSQDNQFQTIKLNGNQLEGPLSKSLANCTQLEVLDLSENKIEDVFPSWLETIQELKVLNLRESKFHGTITSFSVKHPFSKLTIFDVSNNKFSGPLPTSLFEHFQGMKDLNDSINHPPTLSYMDSSLRTLYNDSAVVTMKDQTIELVRILTTFTTIDLSNNMFDGEIPHPSIHPLLY
ncbi:hypothetical protein PIB30_089771, partial [Stylosanthes scabra]|nr:hypothetical protein [Stylosanthes scabra]